MPIGLQEIAAGICFGVKRAHAMRSVFLFCQG